MPLRPPPTAGWMQDPGGGALQQPGAGMEGQGAHHSVKSKSEEHQEKDDGPERRERQPG